MPVHSLVGVGSISRDLPVTIPQFPINIIDRIRAPGMEVERLRSWHIEAWARTPFEWRSVTPLNTITMAIASRGSERRHKQALALMLGYVGMGAGGAAYVLTDRGRRECAIPINGEPHMD